MNAQQATPTLPADRAFVVQFFASDNPAGRAEHVTSGTIAHFASWIDLLAFFESTLAMKAGTIR